MQSIETAIANYVGRVQTVLNSIRVEDVQRISDLVLEAFEGSRTIFVIGNGGSASTASHMACDLNKATSVPGGPRLRVLSLTDNMAWFSALANDLSYEDVFVEQLRHLFKPADLLIAISASGNSPNLVKAVEFVNANGGKTISFVGFTGGRIKELSHAAMHVVGNDYGPVEDGHLVVSHLLTEHLRNRLAAWPRKI